MIAAVALTATGIVSAGSTVAGAAILDQEVVKPSTTSPTVPVTKTGWLNFGAGEGGAPNGATAVFTAGPATPPDGAGSVALSTFDASDGVLFGGIGFPMGASSVSGLPLADVERLEFSTYAASGPLPSFQLGIDFDDVDDSTWQGRLVGAPISSRFAPNQWQMWSGLDAAHVEWFFTRPPGNATCNQTTLCSWDQVLANFPTARIHNGTYASAPTIPIGFVGFKAGSGHTPVTVVNVDRFVIGDADTDAAFDFEPETACTTTCYVDAVTGDDTFGGDTAASAKKTIGAGVAAVASGGTVNVAAGTYSERVSIAKDLSLIGAGVDVTVLDGTSAGAGSGITLTGNRDGVTISDLTVQDFSDSGIYGSPDLASLRNTTIERVKAVTNADGHQIGGGIAFQPPVAAVVEDLVIDNVTASNNTRRGIVVWNGNFNGLTITDSTISNNTLVGVAINDPDDATNVTITGNTVTGNSDSGLGLSGITGGVGNTGDNLISGNTLSSNGRYGIEIKQSTGNGATSGPGSLVVSNNNVSNSSGADARDRAGISVYRRGPQPYTPDTSSGVAVIDNTVTNIRRAATTAGDGFGIVVEGPSHVVSGNTVTQTDVAFQVQGGNPTPNTNGTTFFDRGNAVDGSATISRNAMDLTNSIGLRVVGTASNVEASCNWWGHFTGSSPGGSGSSLVGTANVTPALLSSDLEGLCAAPATVGISTTAVSIDEGDSGNANAVVTVAITSPQSTPTDITYRTVADTADGSDFAGTNSATVTIPANATTASIFVPVIGDGTVELDEFFDVELLAVTSGTALMGSSTVATVTITNDDVEQIDVAFVASVSPAPPRDLPFINRLIANGYTVTVVDDNNVTPTSLVGFDLVVMSSSVVHATIGTKLTNLAVPVVTWEGYLFDDLRLSTGGSETVTTNNNRVTIAAPSHPVAAGKSGTVIIQTVNSAHNQAINPAPGVVVVARTGTVASIVAADVGATLTTGTAPARRVGLPWNYNAAGFANADGSAIFDAAVVWALGAGGNTPPATVNITPTLSVTEGNTGSTNASLTVSISPAQSGPLTVSFTTANGTAQAPGDYTAVTSTLVIPGGTTSATIDIPVVGDIADETNENFTVSLTGVTGTGALGSQATSTVTIIDDDVSSAPRIAFVAGSNPVPSKDRDVVTRLVNSGYLVTVIDDDLLTPTLLATGYEAIVMSSSVLPSKVGTKLTALAVPVVSWETHVTDDLGLASTVGETTTLQSHVVITAAHPVAAGFTGPTGILTSATRFNQAVTAASGVTVVAQNSNGTAAILAADTGAQLVSSMAPARRVVLAWTYDSPPLSNSTGNAIFDAAVTWALGTAPPAP